MSVAFFPPAHSGFCDAGAASAIGVPFVALRARRRTRHVVRAVVVLQVLLVDRHRRRADRLARRAVVEALRADEDADARGGHDVVDRAVAVEVLHEAVRGGEDAVGGDEARAADWLNSAVPPGASYSSATMYG